MHEQTEDAGRLKPVTLKKNKEFGFVYRKGKGKSVRSMTCICAKSRFRGLRVGFVVSAKVGNAVTRNLIRRRMKEAYRNMLSELSAGNMSIVFVVKPVAASSTYAQLVSDMKYLLRKQGVYQEQQQ